MSELRIAVILGSTRPNRNGKAVAHCGGLKNAIDYLYHEWNNKAGYGSVGGARAVEHLRAVCTELQIAHVRQQLSFSRFHDLESVSVFKPVAHHSDAAATMFDQLKTWSRAMRSIRVLAMLE